MRDKGSYGNQSELARRNEELFGELKEEIDNKVRLESQARELIDAFEDLKEKYDTALRDVQDLDVKNNDLTEQLDERSDFIEKLV